MSKKRQRQSKKAKKSINPLKAFRRTIFRSPNVRAGVSLARKSVSASSIPSIIRELVHKPQFSEAICHLTFPKSLEELRNAKRLSSVDARTEFIWCASVLSLYTEQLNEFIKTRDEFERRFLYGDYEQCHKLLDELEGSLGVSMWLIARRIQLLQVSGGLKAQKDYVERVLSVEDIHPLAGYFAFFFGLRSESAVTLQGFREELQDTLSIPIPGLRDHIIYQVCPYYLYEIQNPEKVIEFDETFPVIDRYESFLWMSELCFSRGELEISNKGLDKAIPLLREIYDARLDNLRSLLGGKIDVSKLAESIENFDAYTEGRYCEVEGDLIKYAELKVRSCLLDDVSLHPGESIVSKVAQSMGEVLGVSSEYEKHRSRLKKLAMISFGMPFSQKIAGFLERDMYGVFRENSSQVDKITSVQEVGDPWAVRTIDEIFPGRRYLSVFFESLPQSTSIQLQVALQSDLGVARKIITELPIPPARRDMYLGHIYFKVEKYDEAISSYKSAQNEGGGLIKFASYFFLYKALFSKGSISEAVDLVCTTYFESPASVSLFPLQDLVKAGVKEDSLNSSLSFSILVSLCARNFDSKLERLLSDLYENILHGFGVDRPSKVNFDSACANPDWLVYFLRYICVQRVMDDTIVFDSPEEIEHERIEICRILSEIDPDNENVYSTEIKIIARNERVSEVVRHVHSTKIYVNESGVLSASEERMRIYFDRFIRLIDYPELTDQARNISKKFEALFSDKVNFDLKNIRVPATEKEAVFKDILTYFFDQFAFNQAFGLNVNISSSIRHGSFEGHVRRPFATKGLLCLRSASEKRPVFSRDVEGCVGGLSESERSHIYKCFERFTDRLKRLIEKYLDEYLRIKSLEHPDGMFNFYCSAGEIGEFMDSFESGATYDEFVASLLEFAWGLVDASLSSIRANLNDELRVEVNRSCDALAASIEKKVEHFKVVELVDKVYLAKTEFSAEVDTISSWFNIPLGSTFEPFDIDLAVDVAHDQVDSCYKDTRIQLKKDILFEGRVRGDHLSGFVELFFIFLQNVAKHSDLNLAPVTLSIRRNSELQDCEIKTISNFSEEIDIDDLKSKSKLAEKRFTSDSALDRASNEGGSGLSKLRRILEHDFKCGYSLDLDVAEDRTFTSKLKLSLANILES
ncbi:hypothetical protein ACJJI5_16300 [Microbulbifer sp. EKSA008]|uniref:hypothetical protein n=1 Tax=Microbulbifer sp. EKSA008 TaxID=3243367 RepID=UPI004041ABBB